MRCKAVLCLGVIMLLPPSFIHAQEISNTSDNLPGQFCMSYSIGWGGLSFPIGMVIAGEIAVANFDIGFVHMYKGAKGCWSEYYLSGFGIAASALVILHVDLPFNLNAYVGFGPGIEFTAPGWGFAQTAGITVALSNQFGLQLQEHYIQNIGSSGVVVYGVGVVAKLND